MAKEGQRKTNSSAKKRFRVASNGRVRRKCAGLSHGLMKQTNKQRKQKQTNKSVNKSDSPRVLVMLSAR